jgi:hypothetical protein
METIKKTVNILIMIYLVLALLVYLGILNIGQETNPNFYTNFFLAGGFLMLLELITENIYIWVIKKHQKQQYQHQINQLKASLYDQEQKIQTLTRKHQEELTAQQTKIEHVPPQPRPTAYQPVLTPINPDITFNPAPLPPKPVDPTNNPTKNPDSDKYREPNR